MLKNFASKLEGDEKIGAQIVLAALEAPVRQIAQNAGVDGGVVVEKILSNQNPSFGYDALNDKYVDMIECGIIDPTKVTKSALLNAASASATLLTTESIVVSDDDDKNMQMPQEMPM